MDRIENDSAIRAVVLISRKPDFMAGADIKSFAIEKEGDFRPFQEQGHQALERLEKSQKPIVAAIDGACVGLGTELSLACHGRIATSSPRTKMGLPEVQLGLLPGGGGTQRLPRPHRHPESPGYDADRQKHRRSPGKKMGIGG